MFSLKLSKNGLMIPTITTDDDCEIFTEKQPVAPDKFVQSKQTNKKSTICACVYCAVTRGLLAKHLHPHFWYWMQKRGQRKH